MKKLLFVLILLPIFSFAQSWVEMGAVWHYGYTGVGGEGVRILKYNSDTTIQGKTCQKITGEQYQFMPSGPPPAPIISYGPYVLPPNYTYYSGDTVYYLSHNSVFYPLYIFSAQVSDEWTLWNPADTCCNCVETNVYVSAINTHTINGQNLRTLTILPTGGSNTSFSTGPNGFAAIVTEKIGTTDGGYLFPLNVVCWNDGQHIWDPMMFHFNCFNSPSISYNMANDCDELAPIAEHLKGNNSFTIYPNPTTNTINLQTNYTKAYQIAVYDMAGKLLLIENSKTGNYILDVSALNSGIYLVQISTADGVSTKKLIVE